MQKINESVYAANLTLRSKEMLPQKNYKKTDILMETHRSEIKFKAAFTLNRYEL